MNLQRKGVLIVAEIGIMLDGYIQNKGVNLDKNYFLEKRDDNIMKIIMYGAAICPDCVEAKAILEKHKDIELDYRNITESTRILKEFLSYRDNDKMFTDIVKEGKIGIPFFILEDGTKSLDIFDYLDIEKPKNAANICSIDGSGKC